MRRAQTLGRFFIGAESTVLAGQVGQMTKAQAQQAGARIFLKQIDPRRVLDWRYESGALKEAMVLYDSGTIAVIWTADTMTRVTLDPVGKVQVVDQPVQHGWGRLPIFELHPFDGESQIADVAELNRDVFVNDSLLREELITATYTQRWAFGVREEQFRNVQFGPSRVICIPNPDAKIESTGGDPGQADSLRKTIDDSISELHRCAGLKAEDPLITSPAKSGVALKVEFDEVDAQLSAIAEEAERFETWLIAVYNLSSSGNVDNSVYPETFGTPDAPAELERSLNVLESPKLQPTLRRLEAVRISKILHPKAGQDDRQKMEAEAAEMFDVERQDWPPSAPAAPSFGQGDGGDGNEGGDGDAGDGDDESGGNNQADGAAAA